MTYGRPATRLRPSSSILRVIGKNLTPSRITNESHLLQKAGGLHRGAAIRSACTTRQLHVSSAESVPNRAE